MSDEVLSEEEVAEYESYIREFAVFGAKTFPMTLPEMKHICHTIREAWRELAEWKGRRCGNCRFYKSCWPTMGYCAVVDYLPRATLITGGCPKWEPQPKRGREEMSDQPLTREEREAMRERASKLTPSRRKALRATVERAARSKWDTQFDTDQETADSLAEFRECVRRDVPRLLDALDAAEQVLADAETTRDMQETYIKELNTKLEAAERENKADKCDLAMTLAERNKAEQERDEANARARKAADDLTTYLLQLRTQREQIASLVSERDELRKVVDAECPIGALDLVNSLQAEKRQMMEHLTEVEAEAAAMRRVLESIRAHWKTPPTYLVLGDRLALVDVLKGTAGRDLLAEREELIEALCDVVNQACQVDYDHNDERMIVHHHCLAAYEDAFALLSKLGLLSNYDPTVRGYWLEWPSQTRARAALHPPAKEGTADA
jgi:hypothetical protein